MENFFGDDQEKHSKDFPLSDDYEYILSLLAILGAKNRNNFYDASFLGSTYTHEAYQIPQMVFTRKSKNKEVTSHEPN